MIVISDDESDLSDDGSDVSDEDSEEVSMMSETMSDKKMIKLQESERNSHHKLTVSHHHSKSKRLPPHLRTFKCTEERNFILSFLYRPTTYANLNDFMQAVPRTMVKRYNVTPEYKVKVLDNYIVMRCSQCPRFQVWFSYQGTKDNPTCISHCKSLCLQHIMELHKDKPIEIIDLTWDYHKF